MNNPYVSKTLSNKDTWENSLYFKFLQTCNKEEFLQSQIPFYYAVQAFPQMLLKLASLIETSEERLLVMENLWEEHGNGDSNGFHTTTFKKHLEVLSEDEITLFKNPFVTEWVHSILDKNYSIAQLGSCLAGIEYMYAVISEDIATFIDTLNLNENSVHYTKHSKLDWSHGQELLDVVNNCGFEVDNNAFSSAQQDFIELFEKLTSPTEIELNNIAKLPIAFFYSREDSNVELQALNSLNRNNVDILTVCSGGEHILNYIKEYKGQANIDILDINENQIQVFKNKLYNQKQDVVGKFEFFFDRLRHMLYGSDRSKETPYYISMNKDKLRYLVEILFSRKNLNIVFTDNATKYSSSDFAEHFYYAFINSLEIANVNAMNVFFNSPIFGELNLDNPAEIEKHFNYIVSDFNEFTFTKQYDLIDLSNVGDWMPLEEYQIVIQNARNSLNKGGILIVRKLLGDYKLISLLDDFENVKFCNDMTSFYSETYIAIK